MPVELLKDFIGKKCKINLVSGQFEVTGIILEAEGYWIKIKEEDSNRIINGAMIRDIKIIADK